MAETHSTPNPRRRCDAKGDAIIAEAITVLEQRLRKPGPQTGSPRDSALLATLHLAARDREVFAAMFLDNRHRLLAFRELFYGTIDSTTVHPRQVVREALLCNAAAVVLVHNHPSGVSIPSKSDEDITFHVKDALALVDIRVLDHIVVGHGEFSSMVDKGLGPWAHCPDDEDWPPPIDQRAEQRRKETARFARRLRKILRQADVTGRSAQVAHLVEIGAACQDTAERYVRGERMPFHRRQKERVCRALGVEEHELFKA